MVDAVLEQQVEHVIGDSLISRLERRTAEDDRGAHVAGAAERALFDGHPRVHSPA
jgi:hypothetical protein